MGQASQQHVAQESFKHPVIDAIINVSIASNFIKEKVDEACSPLGITGAQYHVLRILCQSPRQGLSRNEILRRLIEKSVDVTRSINNLVKLGLVIREDDATDRRVVLHRITKEGLEALVKIDGALRGLMMQIMTRVSEPELKTLSELCEKFSLVEQAL